MVFLSELNGIPVSRQVVLPHALVQALQISRKPLAIKQCTVESTFNQLSPELLQPLGLAGEVQSQPQIGICAIGNQLGHPGGMKQARRDPIDEGFTNSGDQWNAGPECIAGGGVRRVWIGIKRQIGQLKSCKVPGKRQLGGEYEAVWVDAARFDLLA